MGNTDNRGQPPPPRGRGFDSEVDEWMSPSRASRMREAHQPTQRGGRGHARRLELCEVTSDMSQSKDQTGRKIRRLEQIARDLRSGRNFNITRLTTIKSLAADPKAACRFALFLAWRAERALRRESRPEGMDAPAWRRGRVLAAEAVVEMPKYLKRRSQGRETTLRQLRREIEELQNEHRPIRWGVVRIIHSRELLIVEQALRCFLSPRDRAHWAYQAARDYAERYDPRYGAGLIPASAPLVEDIAEFWRREYSGGR